MTLAGSHHFCKQRTSSTRPDARATALGHSRIMGSDLARAASVSKHYVPRGSLVLRLAKQHSRCLGAHAELHRLPHHRGDAPVAPLGSGLKPVAGASSGPTRVLLRPRASRGAGGKHGRTHARLSRAAVPVLARFLSGVRAWRLRWLCPAERGADYRVRRGRGRRRCQPWSRSASSSAPKPVSGPSMRNISIVRSGSTWTWLRNASTLRPVSSSIILV